MIAIELGDKDVQDATVCNPPPPKPEPPKPELLPPAPPKAVAPTSSARPNRGLQIAGAGVAATGAVALGFGIYYGIHAQNISNFISTYPTSKPWPADINSLEQTGKNAQTAENRARHRRAGRDRRRHVDDLARPLALASSR